MDVAKIPALALTALLLIFSAHSVVQARNPFPDKEALQGKSSLAYTLRQEVSEYAGTCDEDTSNIGCVDNAETTESDSVEEFRRLKGNIVVGGFILGGKSTISNEETTNTNAYRDFSQTNFGFIGWELIKDNPQEKGGDHLLILIGQAYQRKHFIYYGHRRRFEANSPYQAGVLGKYGFVLAGYSYGEQHERLKVRDTLRDSVDETFDYGFDFKIAGIILGDLEDLGLSVTTERTDKPEVTGTLVSREKSFDMVDRLSLTISDFTLTGSIRRFDETFLQDRFQRFTTHSVELGISVNEHFELSVEQNFTHGQEGFYLAGRLDVYDTTEMDSGLTVKVVF